MKKRIFSMFLCLCMVFTLVGAMVPTATAAIDHPLTDAEITQRITDYINDVKAWRGSGQAYWNDGKDANALKAAVQNEDYTTGLRREACNKNHPTDVDEAKKKHNGRNSSQYCTSNYFDGITIAGETYAGGTQCSGFAAYMEYVIFGTIDSGWEKKDTVEEGYNFRPGDLVQYYDDAIVGLHTAVVYYVRGNSVVFIECNVRKWGTHGSQDYGGDRAFCIIRWNRDNETQNTLRNKVNNSSMYVLRPTSNLRVGGTATINPPDAPTNLTGTWVSTGPKWQAKISWNPVSGATGYEVQYRTPAMGGNEWKTDGDYKTGISYTSTGLGNHNYYEYRVRAYNSGGKSDWVDYTLEKYPVEPTEPTPPAKPENLSVGWTIYRGMNPRISWSAASGAEYYEVMYKKANESFWCSTAPVKSGTSCTFPELSVEASWDFRVKAVNAAGSSDWAERSLSAPQNIIADLIKKDPAIVPTAAAPTGVSGRWTSTGSNAAAELTWNTVSGVDYYEVGYKKDGDSWVTIPSCITSTNTSYVFHNLDSSSSYSFRIKAVKSGVSSAWTECTLDKSGVEELAAPTGVSGTWTSTGPKWQARISWNAVSGATRYEVQYKTPKTGNAWKTDGDYKSGTSYISTGLGDYNSYDYRVRACNSAGFSDWTTYTLVKTTTMALAAPTGVSGTWTSSSYEWEAKISWNAVSGATRYEVQYRTPKTGNEWRADPDYASGTSYISTGLGNYNSYDYRVRAVNAAGVSDWTEYTLAKPTSTQESTTPPAAPTNISGEWTSTGPKWQARISWSPVSSATRYEVQYRTPSTGNAWRADADYSSGTSYISTGLGNYNSYDYRVRAVNANGASSWTEYTLVKPGSTPEPTPAAPTNVSGTWTSRGPKWQARISWNAVSGATRYEVQYRTPKTNNEWRTDADYSSGTSYISTGLGNYNSYDYRVRAVNATGASEWAEYTLYK